MKQIYLARDPITANIMKNLLEEQDIPAIVQGELLLPAHSGTGVMYPTVWVLRDEDVDRARYLVEEFERHDAQGKDGSWQCPQCGEVLEAQFTECWQCGHSHP